jgi:galactitol-specific phosphotransferase system IIC component
MTLYDVVTKLVGSVNPIGDTVIDETRFENLKILTMLVDSLIKDIDGVASLKMSHEFSVKKAGKFADDFLTSIGIIE